MNPHKYAFTETSMTIRDYVAIEMAKAYISCPERRIADIPKEAYTMANRLIAESNK